MPSLGTHIDIDAIPLIGGHPAVDFVNTVEDRHGPSEINYLHDPARFVAWAARLGVVRRPAKAGAVARRRHDGPSALRTWRRAMKFRDDMHATLMAAALGRPLPEPSLQRLSRMAHWAAARSQLDAMGGALVLCPLSTLSVHESALVALVQEAVGLLTSDALDRVRKCAHEPCDWIFLDHSRNGMRRWCRMETCGNRSKVRRHRAKIKAGRSA